MRSWGWDWFLEPMKFIYVYSLCTYYSNPRYSRQQQAISRRRDSRMLLLKTFIFCLSRLIPSSGKHRIILFHSQLLNGKENQQTTNLLLTLSIQSRYANLAISIVPYLLQRFWMCVLNSPNKKLECADVLQTQLFTSAATGSQKMPLSGARRQGIMTRIVLKKIFRI